MSISSPTPLLLAAMTTSKSLQNTFQHHHRLHACLPGWSIVKLLVKYVSRDPRTSRAFISAHLHPLLEHMANEGDDPGPQSIAAGKLHYTIHHWAIIIPIRYDQPTGKSKSLPAVCIER